LKCLSGVRELEVVLVLVEVMRECDVAKCKVGDMCARKDPA